MSRRSFFRVLLSLLLLISQQMSMSHAMSHLSGLGDYAPQATSQQVAGDALSSALAKDQSCHQCLAFAQLAGAVGAPDRNWVASFALPTFTISFISSPHCARTTCVFQSRAPPAAI